MTPAAHFHKAVGVCCFSALSRERLSSFCRTVPVTFRRRLSSEKERLLRVSRLRTTADTCCLPVLSGGERRIISHWRMLSLSLLRLPPEKRLSVCRRYVSSCRHTDFSRCFRTEQAGRNTICPMSRHPIVKRHPLFFFILFPVSVFISIVDSEQRTGKSGYLAESDQYGIMYLACRRAPEAHEQQRDPRQRQRDGHSQLAGEPDGAFSYSPAYSSSALKQGQAFRAPKSRWPHIRLPGKRMIRSFNKIRIDSFCPSVRVSRKPPAASSPPS